MITITLDELDFLSGEILPTSQHAIQPPLTIPGDTMQRRTIKDIDFLHHALGIVFLGQTTEIVGDVDDGEELVGVETERFELCGTGDVETCLHDGFFGWEEVAELFDVARYVVLREEFEEV